MPTGIIVDITDFTNDGSYYQFPNDPEINIKLQAWIDKYERKYIYQILGQVQGDYMIADCEANNGVPELPANVAIFNEININDPNDSYDLRQSEGLKNVLLSLIYYWFATSAQYKSALVGFVSPGADTAGKLSYQNTFIVAESRWNEAVEWIHAIQWYCLLYLPANYPNFYGQIFDGASADFL